MNKTENGISSLKKEERYHRQESLKFFAVILWGLFLGIHTWTENLEALLRFQTIKFEWHSSPDFLQFFNFYDIQLIHPYWFWIKLGHFTGFAIMDVLLYIWLKDHKQSILISVAFAFTTEILQLFFGRDGRLYDLLIDSFGVLTVYYLLKKSTIFQKIISHFL
ncbi:VanZ family protein [Bacillus smithii]|uniref:VanZ family protein n=1 Tax=Bacillus smithii TaxID=1479 RepID=UPI003D1BD4B0